MLKDAFRTIQNALMLFWILEQFSSFSPTVQAVFQLQFCIFDWLDGNFQSNRVSMFVVGSEKNLTQKTNYKKTVINLKLQ